MDIIKKIFPSKNLPKSKKNIILFIGLIFLIVFLFLTDLLTKYFMFQHYFYSPYMVKMANSTPYCTRSDVAIPGLFDMTLVFNNGAAWNMLSNHKWLLSLLSLIGSLAFIYVFVFYFNKLNLGLKISLCLMFSGCFGNMIDRFGYWIGLPGIYQYGVIDFIQFHFWKNFPVFNFADAFLIIGIIVAAISYIVMLVKQFKNEKQIETNSSSFSNLDLEDKLKQNKENNKDE